ncbi:hypothetical protein C8Q78DRAFT_339444 [Trametes maxima]|nr:hypothetical protein C8Q78DRAFT_339444 [Trametes maxima]
MGFDGNDEAFRDLMRMIRRTAARRVNLYIPYKWQNPADIMAIKRDVLAKVPELGEKYVNAWPITWYLRTALKQHNAAHKARLQSLLGLPTEGGQHLAKKKMMILGRRMGVDERAYIFHNGRLSLRDARSTPRTRSTSSKKSDSDEASRTVGPAEGAVGMTQVGHTSPSVESQGSTRASGSLTWGGDADIIDKETPCSLCEPEDDLEEAREGGSSRRPITKDYTVSSRTKAPPSDTVNKTAHAHHGKSLAPTPSVSRGCHSSSPFNHSGVPNLGGETSGSSDCEVIDVDPKKRPTRTLPSPPIVLIPSRRQSQDSNNAISETHTHASATPRLRRARAVPGGVSGPVPANASSSGAVVDLLLTNAIPPAAAERIARLLASQGIEGRAWLRVFARMGTRDAWLREMRDEGRMTEIEYRLRNRLSPNLRRVTTICYNGISLGGYSAHSLRDFVL